MPAIADHALTDCRFINPSAITAPFFQRPEERLGYQACLHSKNLSPTVSNVIIFADNWLWNAMDSYVAWFNWSPAFSATSEPASAWKRYVFDTNANTDVDAISETVGAVFEVIATLGPKVIDLSGFSSRSVNGEHLATVLRVTAPYRTEVRGWNEALSVATEALNSAGLDHRDALAGLIQG